MMTELEEQGTRRTTERKTGRKNTVKLLISYLQLPAS